LILSCKIFCILRVSRFPGVLKGSKLLHWGKWENFGGNRPTRLTCKRGCLEYDVHFNRPLTIVSHGYFSDLGVDAKLTLR